MHLREVIIIITILLATSHAGAIQVIHLPEGPESLALGPNFEYLIDSNCDLAPENVLNLPDDRFTKAAEEVPKFFFGTNQVWVRFTLINDSDYSVSRLLILELPYTVHADLSYMSKNGNLVTVRKGWVTEGHRIARRTLIPSYRINLSPGEERTFALMVGSDAPISLGLRLVDENTFMEWDHFVGFVYALFLILALGLAVFHFSIYYYNRKRAYLYIGPFAISYAMIFYIGSGSAATQFPGFWVPFCRELFPFAIASTQFWGLLFTRNFFSTKKSVSRMDVLLKILVVLSTLSLLFSLVAPGKIFFLLWILTLFALMMMCIVPVVAYAKGQRSAGLYLIGIVTFALLVLLTALVSFGIVTPQPLTLLVSASGFLIIAIMATIAVAAESRYKENLYHDQVKRLNWKLATTEERERQRIAEDLHDGVCQLLTGAKLQISFIRDNACSGAHREMFEAGLGAISEAYEQAKKVIYDLNPPILQNLGLKATLSDYLDDFEKRYGIETEFRMEGIPFRIEPPRSSLLFRFFKEIMTNALKYAQSQQIMVRLCFEEENVVLNVSDNGIGFDWSSVYESGTTSGGLGLLSIRNQIERFDGELVINSRPGNGTHIRLSIPLESKEELA